jgi:hypothetical protein
MDWRESWGKFERVGGSLRGLEKIGGNWRGLEGIEKD